jgi:DNA-binding GntR family transcriptional regulator
MKTAAKTAPLDLELPSGTTAALRREQVITALRNAILDFRLKPGQRLIEREIIESLGVSRTTVREALSELAAEGLLTIIPQKGALVSTPTAEEALDLYDIRASLEAMTVERFVARATQSQVIMFEAAVERFSELAEAQASIKELLQTKDDMFGILLEGAGSQALRQIVEGIQVRVRILRATSMSSHDRVLESVKELRDVAGAIRSRDAGQAARLYSAHIHAASKATMNKLPLIEGS